MKIVHVCTGQVRSVRIAERNIATAIGKSPVAGPVGVKLLGLRGDEQADPSRHGGLAKAIYAYPAQHLPFWRTVRAQARVGLWDEPVPPGLFGENLLIDGMSEDQLWIGDRLVLPGCVLAVSEPRFPCFKFNAALGFAQAGRLMNQSGYCGAYLAVIEPGTLQAGDAIELQPGPREVNLRELFRARAASPSGTAAP